MAEESKTITIVANNLVDEALAELTRYAKSPLLKPIVKAFIDGLAHQRDFVQVRAFEEDGTIGTVIALNIEASDKFADFLAALRVLDHRI